MIVKSVEELTKPCVITFHTKGASAVWEDILQCLEHCFLMIILCFLLFHGSEFIANLNLIQIMHPLLLSIFFQCMCTIMTFLGFGFANLEKNSNFDSALPTFIVSMYTDLQLSTFLVLICRPLSIDLDRSFNFSVKNFLLTFCSSICGTHVDVIEFGLHNWHTTSHLGCVFMQILTIRYFVQSYLNFSSIITLFFFMCLRTTLECILMYFSNFSTPYTVCMILDFCIGYQFFFCQRQIYNYMHTFSLDRWVYCSLICMLYRCLLNMGLSLLQPIFLQRVTLCVKLHSFSNCHLMFLPSFPLDQIVTYNILIATIVQNYNVAQEDMDEFTEHVLHESQAHEVSISRFVNVFAALIFTTPFCIGSHVLCKLLFDMNYDCFFFVSCFIISPTIIILFVRLLNNCRQHIISEFLTCGIKLCQKIWPSVPSDFVAVDQDSNMLEEVQGKDEHELAKSNMKT